MKRKRRKKYTSGPRYLNVPVLLNTGTFLVYQYCVKMRYLRSLERAGVIQKLTILEHKNGLVLANTRVPVSGTWSILFPKRPFFFLMKFSHCIWGANSYILPNFKQSSIFFFNVLNLLLETSNPKESCL